MAELEQIRYRVPQGVRESILAALRQAIVTGQLKPKERITERMLCQHFGTSTMPIKEALRILEAEGLVETVPRRGSFVSDFASVHLTEIYTIRAALEGLAANFAAKKASVEEIEQMEKLLAKSRELVSLGKDEELVECNTSIHEAIRVASGNPILRCMIKGVVSYDLIIRRMALRSPEERELGWKEHASVVEAIRERRPEQAEERLRKHIIRSGQNTMARLGE